MSGFLCSLSAQALTTERNGATYSKLRFRQQKMNFNPAEICAEAGALPLCQCLCFERLQLCFCPAIQAVDREKEAVSIQSSDKTCHLNCTLAASFTKITFKKQFSQRPT